RWGGYHPVAVDDTKLHRTSEGVWGACTFHESAARSPNRAETVRAHNWVVMGDLLPGRPWTFLPHSSRLYLRKSQLPEGEVFRTKTEWAVEMLRQVDAESEAPLLGVFDGAYAMETVVKPCLQPPPGRRRIEIVTRLRVDARLYQPADPGRSAAGKKVTGRPRKWGRRMAAPQHHHQWDTAWHKGSAWIYGRVRKFRYKRVLCQWFVSGPEELVHAFVFEVEGYDKPWFLVTTALDLSAEQVVEAFGARFRQEDGFRDHKQRLGMEECRAWTKEPVLRTFQVQMVALTLLRLIQFRLDAAWGEGSYWLKPQWNPRKQHPSILDLRRLFWRHRARFCKLLLELEEIEKVPQAAISARERTDIAA
ncbi:MAG: IS701 family transposase, partial [Burkholderiales bacterium]